MNDGVGDFVRKRWEVARPTGAADEPVIFPKGGQGPGWATVTGLFETLGGKPSSRDPEATQPLSPLDVEYAVALLQRRLPWTPEVAALTWRTQDGTEVVPGDLVALDVLGDRDAVGRILGQTEEGKVACAMGDYPGTGGPRVYVDAEQLLLLVRRGVKPDVPYHH